MATPRRSPSVARRSDTSRACGRSPRLREIPGGGEDLGRRGKRLRREEPAGAGELPDDEQKERADPARGARAQRAGGKAGARRPTRNDSGCKGVGAHVVTISPLSIKLVDNIQCALAAPVHPLARQYGDRNCSASPIGEDHCCSGRYGPGRQRRETAHATCRRRSDRGCGVRISGSSIHAGATYRACRRRARLPYVGCVLPQRLDQLGAQHGVQRAGARHAPLQQLDQAPVHHARRLSLCSCLRNFIGRPVALCPSQQGVSIRVRRLTGDARPEDLTRQNERVTV